MIKKIVLLVLFIIICLSIYINAQSEELRVSRSLAITAPPEVIFNQVNDFHNWENWSPWAKLDPNMKIQYSGLQKGEGASYSWDGNKDVGQGVNTIIKSIPNELVKVKLEFIKPFEATSSAEFTFKPQDKQTNVTWTMLGTKNFIMKAMSLVIDCDKMMGAQFEEGLAHLKKFVE